MKSTGQKLILLSFILAVIAAAVVFWYLRSLSSPKQAAKKVVLVAAETIPPRTLLDKKMIKEIEVADDTLYAEYLKTSSDIIGKYTKETILKNEGFHKDKLLDKTSDELSIKLDKDHRAVSINATGASGVSDLLKPGDFVDIVVYLAEIKDKDTIIRPDIAKIILQKIEVLAVDKQLARDEKAPAEADKEKSTTSFLVTLSVKTTDIEELFLSENMGNLKLALRPINDDKTTGTDGAVWQELFIEDSNSSNTNSSGSTDSSDGKYTSYTIKRGDTLRTISLAFYGDKSKYTIIKDANNIKNENIIIVGQVIKVPVLQ